jgi:hypothetical protein
VARYASKLVEVGVGVEAASRASLSRSFMRMVTPKARRIWLFRVALAFLRDWSLAARSAGERCGSTPAIRD